MSELDEGPSLRVAVVAPPWYAIPPQGYGGIESMVHLLAEGLHARGHDVTVIGAGPRAIAGRFLATFADPPSERIGQVLPEVNKRGMAGLGMKSLGGNGQPITQGVVTVQEALRYAMSLPVATTISGMRASSSSVTGTYGIPIAAAGRKGYSSRFLRSPQAIR